MRNTARQIRENRTITVNFQNKATYFQLLDNGKAFVECVIAFILSLGFRLKYKAICHGGGCLTRHAHSMRVRLGGVSIWRIQCTTYKAVFTVLPHCVLRYRQMRPGVARDALVATHGGLRLERCAVICHIRLRRFADHVAHTAGVANGVRVRQWFQEKKAGTLLDQAHNAIDRKLFMMKGFHHPQGNQQAFLTGLAHLYNLVQYQRRAQHAGQCGVEVERGTVPTRTWLLNLQILTLGGCR